MKYFFRSQGRLLDRYKPVKEIKQGVVKSEGGGDMSLQGQQQGIQNSFVGGT